MKNLWLFLVRYNAFFWFILFFVASVLLVVRHNRFQRSIFINSSNVLVGSIYDHLNSWKSYLSLEETNKSLASENARLRQQLQTLLLQDGVDSIAISDSIDFDRYRFTIAEVVNNSVHEKITFITLNRSEERRVGKECRCRCTADA